MNIFINFCVCDNKISSRKFDLKGSTVDREASDKELEKTLPTLKDNDFIKQKIRIYIGDIAKTKFMEMMNADVNVNYFLIISVTLWQRLIVNNVSVLSQITSNGLFVTSRNT